MACGETAPEIVVSFAVTPAGRFRRRLGTICKAIL